ncbi:MULTISPECIES: hypothetical protein [Citrobacter]|uniref:hypothetical protein n=1 Tax=Citrobacter TaxID=544 RepID=UPI000380F778|nr:MULTISPECIES: hypothetical protein [Citrobacter]KHE04764.1 hypothetical protein IB70_12990 [Citrobacter braakii]MBJ8848557.1 hypothetical protein [Citrobacter braakii]MDU2846951.1 hypothetical protein [Citrobacter sp.]
MKKVFISVVAVLAISACKPSLDEFIRAGESLVKETLKDPESAKFESFFHSSGENDGYVCGTVNAKNSYGGYTGKKKFYVYLELYKGKVKTNGPVTIVNELEGAEYEKYKLFCR